MLTPDETPAGAVPPDDKFWRKYSPRLEFPISLVLSLLLLLAAFATLVGFMLLGIGDGPQKKTPPISLVDGGLDDAGNGSPGAKGGGTDAAEKLVPSAPQETPEPVPTDAPPEPTVKEPTVTPDDPNGSKPTPVAEASAAYASLEDAARKALIGPKGTPGQGDPKGDSRGKGPGGIGSDSTRARSLRWTIGFTTNSGRDYLDQLHALGAKVLVPDPSDPRKMTLFTDLKNPKPGTVASDADLVAFGGQMQFCDTKPDSVREVGKALGLPTAPTAFWAIFPKGIETELTALEVKYRGLRSSEIEQTRFSVSVVGGRYQLRVTDQTVKR